MTPQTCVLPPHCLPHSLALWSGFTDLSHLSVLGIMVSILHGINWKITSSMATQSLKYHRTSHMAGGYLAVLIEELGFGRNRVRDTHVTKSKFALLAAGQANESER